MNILLSRILTYLNGTLFHDYNYKICTFIIFHYLEMEDMSEEDFLKKVALKKKNSMLLLPYLVSMNMKNLEKHLLTIIRHV